MQCALNTDPNRKELANYGEYSGAPSEDLTCEYAKTVLGLVTASIHPEA